jgi:hypothetical protein
VQLVSMKTAGPGYGLKPITSPEDDADPDMKGSVGETDPTATELSRVHTEPDNCKVYLVPLPFTARRASMGGRRRGPSGRRNHPWRSWQASMGKPWGKRAATSLFPH